MNPRFVAERIQKMCAAADIKVNVMLANAGVNKNAVVNMANGSCPSVDIIEKIANFFRVSINTILYEQSDDDYIFWVLKNCPNLLIDTKCKTIHIRDNAEEYIIRKTSGDENLNRELILYKLQEVRQAEEYDLLEFLEINGLSRDCFDRLKSFECLTINEAEILSRILNIDKSEIYRRYPIAGLPESNKFDNIFQLSENEKSLLNKYRTLDEYGKNSVLSIINAEKYRIDNSKLAATARDDDHKSPRTVSDNLDNVPIMDEE